MAGTADRGVSSAISFAEAAPADEAEIRRMLRENPLGGAYAISLEREPDGFGGPHLADERRCFILARDEASGEVIGLCERVVRPAWVNGEVRLLPYLGALRISGSHRRRIAILKGGFAALRQHAEQPDELPYALTSITTDNSPARRVLTAGLKGLPQYSPAGDYATLILRPRQFPISKGVRIAQVQDMPELTAFLAEQNRAHQFAQVWSEADLTAIVGLQWLLLRDNGRIVGCASLWDQNASRQVVVRSYPHLVGAFRPVLNLIAPLAGLPRLPQPGLPIAQAFLSNLVLQGDDERAMVQLIKAGLSLAKGLALAAVVLGCPADHSWRAAIKTKFRTIEYLTSLYLVHWPDGAEALPRDTKIYPDVSLL
jgi:hypothetical protein